MEILREAFSLVNFPATVFFLVVVGYWILAIVGVMEVDFDAGDIMDGHSSASEMADAGLWARCGRFLHLDQVPLMVVLSVLALCVWPLSILGNYFLNGTPGNRSAVIAVGLLGANLMVSLLATRVIVSPLRRVFAALHSAKTEAEHVVGRTGRVVSAKVDDRYGQVEIVTTAAPLLVNARTGTGVPPLPRGSGVMVFAAAPDNEYYLVKPVDALEDFLTPESPTE